MPTPEKLRSEATCFGRHRVVNRQNFQPRGKIHCLPEEGAAIEMCANQHLGQRGSRDAYLFAEGLDLLHL